ncbi:MAG: antitoxin component YwqK of YwqJK toxin-antitoxin module [Flavobacteriales bacterium]|jgi:antitoxin component YwqK of YwqJK toxin-antitoxin module
MKPTIKYLFCLSLFALVANLANAQHPWPAEGEENIDYYLNNKDKPKPDGLHYRTYQEGRIYYSGEFQGGKPKASSTMFYYYQEKAGAIMTTHEFGASVADVHAVNYHLSGRKMSEGDYINQLKQGQWQFYDEDGALQYLQDFVNDIENGIHQTYYQTGKVCKEETFVNGVLHGPWKELYADQQLKASGIYKDGDYDGQIVHFHPNGTKLSEGKYVNGLQEGTWLTYHSDGRVELNILYREGKKAKEKKENGTFMEHYASAVPKSEYSYADGLMDGPFTKWYDIGEWVREPRPGGEGGMEMEYVEELRHTQIATEGNYMKGKLEGEIITYDEDGKLIKTENYSNGELQSAE